MPSPSPGFVGSRLREARESRQMSSAGLAGLVGVTPQGMSQYEHGHTTPSPEMLARLTEVLKFKVEFFFRPDDEPTQTIFERSRSSATKATRQSARHRRTWLRDILRYLGQFVRLPDPKVPEQNVNWLGLSDEDIETAARDVRREWGLGDGPISNVTLLVENHGVIVTLMTMNADHLDAFSTWDRADQRPYIVLGENTQSAFRTRFNVCHELAHLVLHREVSPLEASDRRYFKIIEAQADRFAAAFLTPASTFSPDVSYPTLDVFRTLKPRWRTSIKMMVHRARELELIDHDEARRLYINYNRRGWHHKEPLDEQPIEEPRLVRRAVETVVDNGVVRPSQIAAALPFNAEDIEQLAHLPYGYLDEESAYTWAVRELNSGFHVTPPQPRGARVSQWSRLYQNCPPKRGFDTKPRNRQRGLP